jgi:hypothetical protein
LLDQPVAVLHQILAPFLTALVDYGNTFTLSDIEIRDGEGGVVSALDLTPESGYAYSFAVREPSTGILVASALLAPAARSRVRPPR